MVNRIVSKRKINLYKNKADELIDNKDIPTVLMIHEFIKALDNAVIDFSELYSFGCPKD